MRTRPTEKDEDVRKAAVPAVVKMLEKWLRGKGEESTDDVAEVAAFLVGQPTHMNGYELAKEIERDFFFDDIDEELVEELGCVSSHVRDAVRAATRKWVEEHKVVCPFALEQKVKVKKSGDVGLVTMVYEEEALTCVFMPQKGHVREGTGSHGLVVSYEDLEAV